MKLLLNQDGQAGGGSQGVFADAGSATQTGASGAEGQQSQSAGDQGGQAGAGDGAQTGQQQQQTAAAPQQTQQAPATQGLTPDAIAEAIKKAGLAIPQQSQQQQQTQQQQRQYTQEDFDRVLNVWKPTPTLLKALREGDEQTALVEIANMAAGVNRQSVTMASMMLQDFRDKLMEQLDPYLRYVTQDNETKLWNEFLSAPGHEDLKGTEPIIKLIVAEMKAEVQRTGKTLTKEEGFKTLAERTRAMVKQLQLQGSAQAQQGAGGQQQAAQTKSKMPTLSGGGQTGSGGAGNKPPPKSGAMAVFG